MTSIAEWYPTSGSSGLASWVYLLDWGLVLILGLAFVFYFARLVGYVLSTILRVTVWKRYKLRVSMGAFRVSPLGGRITAANVVVSNADYTISILRLNLTWRYWFLRMPRVSEYLLQRAEAHEEMAGLTPEQNKKLPTSVKLLVDGLEIFMYNRTAAYDNIVEALKKEGSINSETLRQHCSGTSLKESPSALSDHSDYSDSTIASSEGYMLKFLLRTLPLLARIKRGAFVLGNHTTPSIMIASFKTGNAILDVTKSPSALDNFRTVFDIIMEKFQISLKPNITYDPLRYTEEGGDKPEPTTYSLGIFKTFAKALIPHRHKDAFTPEGREAWSGLRRYVEEFETDRLAELPEIDEYAKYSLILDSVSTQLTYYYDSPGLNPPKSMLEDLETFPKFGVDLLVSMATVHYGSWADRQRGPLQTLLFPVLYRDQEPTVIQKEPGFARTYAGFDLQIKTKDEIILRVPTREFSKRKEEIAAGGSKQAKSTRPFGWIELKFGSDLIISSFTSYFAYENGSPNVAKIHMSDLEVRTSVNHHVFFSAEEHDVVCDIGFPLKWNGECKWKFDMCTSNGKFFFLREHIFLLTDLVSDFGSGAPTPYEHHRPFEYSLNWQVYNFKLYFNVNDHNIINDPLDFNTNKYLCFCGETLRVNLVIPLKGPFTKSARVDYKLSTDALELFLEVPPWHTVSQFMKGNKKMGSTGAFEVSGYYSYYNAIEVDHNNFCVINAIGDDITLMFYGYLIRYLFTLRENYFGDFKNFKTFEEYTHGLNTGPGEAESMMSAATESTPDPDYWKILKTENDMNVLFTFLTRNGTIVLPCQIYNHSHHIALTFDYLDVDIYLNHYYMDLQADFSTGYGRHVRLDPSIPSNIVFDHAEYNALTGLKKPEISIDGFSVHTHRMFGLAPDLLTYQCKWDFASGLIKIEGSPLCLSGLKAMGEAFALGFKDLENTLIYNVPIIYDAASFTFRCPEILLKLDSGIDDTQVEIIASELLVSFNDIANLRYSSKTAVSIALITMKIISETDGVKYDGFMKTSLVFTNICQKQKMLEHRKLQQQHVRQSDAPTHRAPFLIFPEGKDEVYMDALGSVFPSVSLPSASHPLTKEYADVHKANDSDSTLGSSQASANSSEESYFDEYERMAPTTDYDDRDFCPQTAPTEGIKYDTFVLEFEPIEVFLNPRGFKAYSSLVSRFHNMDLQFLIDKLQLQTVKSLKQLIFPIPTVDNVRLVCASIDIKIAQESLKDPAVVFCTSPLIPVVTLSIVEPSLAQSAFTMRERQGPDLVVTESSQMALHVREVYVSVHSPECFSSAINLLVNDIQCWLTKEDKSGMVCSASIDKVDVTAETRFLDWLIGFISVLVRDLGEARKDFKLSVQAQEKWRSELIYMLVKASQDHNIEQDPEVITKPASILRSCEDHVRFYDRWKLVTKLRSILNLLPSFELENRKFIDRDWTAPEDALTQVTSFFMNWRVWEAQIGQRVRYLDQMFGKDKQACSDAITCFKLNTVVFNLNHSSVPAENILLQDLTFLLRKSSGLVASRLGNCVNFGVLAHAEACDITITPNLLKLLDVVSGHMDTVSGNATEASDEGLKPEADSSNLKSKEAENSLLFFILNFKLFHLQVDLPHTYWDIYTYENTSIAQVGLPLSGLVFGNFATQSKEYSLSFGRGDTKLLDLSFKDLLAVTSGMKLETNLTGSANIQLDELEVKLLDQDGNLLLVLDEFLNKDLKILKSHLSKRKLTNNSSKVEPPPQTESPLPLFKVDILIRQASCLIEMLYPLRFHGLLVDNRLRFGHTQDQVMFEYSHKSIVSELEILDLHVLRTENSHLKISSQMLKLDDNWLVDGTANLGYLKVDHPQFFNAAEKVLKQKDVLMDRFTALQSMLKDSSSEEITTTKKPLIKEGKNLFANIALRLRVLLEYFGWSAFRDHSRHTLEFEGLKAMIANVSANADMMGKIVPIWGDISIPAIRATILDPQIPVGLSTILDFNLSVKVLNDWSHNEEDPQHSLQIESEYFRVCLSPPVLLNIYKLTDRLRRLANNFDLPEKPKQEPNATKGSSQAPSMFHLSSVHFLSYNFCVGWLFGTSHKDYPGFILGTERIFAVTKADIGKLTMIDGYLSVANGSTSSSFYSTLSEMSSLNRAFMRQIQLNYCVTDESRLCINLQSDELDVRFMSNSAVLIERAIKSFGEIQSSLEKKKETKWDIQAITEPKTPTETKPAPTKKSFMLHFTTIQLSTRFAGAKVFIYRLHEESLTDAPPSLSLHSPTVLIAVSYNRIRNGEKKHAIKTEVLMSQSDNVIYSSCVPAVMDYIDAFKGMFRDSKSPQESNKKAIKEQSSPQKSSEVGADFGRLLDDFDVQFGFIIEKQKLSLSCEPTAKVAAVVEYDGASILACSGIEDYSSMYVFTKLDKIYASLQHVYSDERSGSVQINSILFSSMFAFNPTIDILTSISVSEISGYIKMKQSQDLDLFKDIWYPKEYRSQPEPNANSKKEKMKREKNEFGLSRKASRNRMKETATTSAIPFAFNMMLSNFSLEVDLGPSLGVVMLDVDRAWAISRKTANWFYEMKIGVQSLVVGSEGRLGGYLKMDKFCFSTTIEWKLDDMPYLEVPLVHLAVGFDKIQMKTIFDSHVFAFANLAGWKLDAFNQKNGLNISKDHLFVVIKYETVEVYLTSLAASDFFDIYSAISRMIEEKKTSYKEILNDSKDDEGKKDQSINILLESTKKLDSKIEVITGTTRLMVFPHSFADSKALVIELDRSRASFVQTEFDSGIMNEIELQLNHVRASFSSLVKVAPEVIYAFEVDDFVEYARKAKGGGIISLPKFMISMRTHQQYGQNIVDYSFQSSFGGTVDIRWNLGSVNVVREMYAAHKRAFLSRTEFSKDVPRLDDDLDLKESILKGADVTSRVSKTVEVDPLDTGDAPHKDIDADIQDTIEKVANTSKFVYKALVPPIIEAPQLKELGNATPPLEWFGLHRNKFPDATHQLVIVTLQKLIHEIEEHYSKVLGKA